MKFIKAVILVSAVALLQLNCTLVMPNILSGHPMNRDAGTYKPVETTIANTTKGFPYNFYTNIIKYPIIFGEYVIPVMAKDAEIGETIIQKGAMSCYFFYLCTNQMTLNDYKDIYSKNIATVDYKVKTYFGLVTHVDILISYSAKDQNK